LGERLAVRLHLMMCRFCSRYRKQLQMLRVVANRYVQEIEPSRSLDLFSLPEEARSRIQRALADQMLEKHRYSNQEPPSRLDSTTLTTPSIPAASCGMQKYR
jgi:hypothetical protein